MKIMITIMSLIMMIIIHHKLVSLNNKIKHTVKVMKYEKHTG